MVSQIDITYTQIINYFNVYCRRTIRLLLFIFSIPLLFSIFYLHSRGTVKEHHSQFNSIDWDLGLYVKYNLMEETYGGKWNKTPEKYHLYNNCTLEYANSNKLQQDHPCVIRLIQNTFLRQPSSIHIPYNLNYPEKSDPSDGQSKGILRLLRNQTNGFFIECGGYDGEHLSNTLFMERFLNWKGMLIEANKKSFDLLSTRNRKAYMSPVCLSTNPYPMQVFYNTTHTLRSSIVEKEETTFGQETGSQSSEYFLTNNSENVYKTQCFPLYSLLLAVGRTQIDYFSLDVEGSEYKILKTIPWEKVDIKTLTVEWDHTVEGEGAITRLLVNNGFVKFGHIEMSYSREVVFVQDFLKDLRLYE
ncbi:uncharacterized protein LOC124200519 [Daphnia pulex]|uniref:uncharacterized protein LOC124200519 n=1 Tax=Daphnia pulex TaxID=6669 RepID=UPI001EE054D4|nr:uncharacterized protein LOC124200519 [Daphnia pulex]